MKCPKCGSKNTKYVSIMDERYKVGAQRCKTCDYQSHWLDFYWSAYYEWHLIGRKGLKND